MVACKGENEMAELTSSYISKMVMLGARKKELTCVIATICDVYNLLTGEPKNELIIQANMVLNDREWGGGKNRENR